MIIPRLVFGKGFHDLVLDFMAYPWGWCLMAFFSKSGLVLKWRQMGFMLPSQALCDALAWSCGMIAVCLVGSNALGGYIGTSVGL